MEHVQCPTLIKQAFSEIESLFASSSGRQTIEQELMLCSPLDSDSTQLRILNLWIENAFASLGMENYPYPVGGLPAFPMRVACDVMYTTVQSESLVFFFSLFLSLHLLLFLFF